MSLESEAQDRAWEVVRRAFDERPPSRRRTRVLPAALATAAVAVVVAAVLSPPGRAVFESVRRAVGISQTAPTLAGLPAPGRLLVVAEGNAWIVGPTGERRELGAFRDAQWSPHGLYVVATTATRLIALTPQGDVRWSLARPAPRFPRWQGTYTDTRIAYLSGGLHVVAGDGTGDRLLDPHASAVAPAWKPGSSRILAYVNGEVVVARNATSGSVAWRTRIAGRPTALDWSSDGRYLAVVTTLRAVVLDDRGHVVRRLSYPGAVVAGASFRPGSDRLAVSLRIARRSEVRLVDVTSRASGALLFAGPGAFGGLAWSPNGGWLLLDWPTADQWLFVSGSRVRAVANIRREFELQGRSPLTLDLAGRWCCAATR